MESENKRFFKLFSYLLLGVIFNYLGLVLGGLWIKFRVQSNKRAKFVALVFGFLIFIILSLGLTWFIYLKYPETKTIKDAIGKEYPSGSVKVGINWSKVWQQGQPVELTKTLTIQFKSRELITGEQAQKMGQTACSILQTKSKQYDKVSVVNNQTPLYPVSIPFIYFGSSVKITAPCSDWLNDSFLNQFQGLLNTNPLMNTDPLTEAKNTQERINRSRELLKNRGTQ